MEFFNCFFNPETTTCTNDKEMKCYSELPKENDKDTDSEIIVNDRYVDIVNSSPALSSKSSPVQELTREYLVEMGDYYLITRPSSNTVNVTSFQYKLTRAQSNFTSNSYMSGNNVYINKKLTSKIKSIRKYLMDSSF